MKTNSVKAWLLATRPKTLTAAVVPVLTAIAYGLRDSRLAVLQGQTEEGACGIRWTAAVLCLLFAWVMQIDSNLVNDYFDFKKGNDDETRLGPKRACAEGWITLGAMKAGILVTTLAGCLVGLPLVVYGGWAMVAVGAACVLFCFLYTITLSYHGLGDLLVLVFFGIVPVCCSYYVIMPEGQGGVTVELFLSSVACGMVVDTLLVVNNYRDRDNDRRAGKRTLIISLTDRWGERSGEWLYLLLGDIPFLWMAASSAFRLTAFGAAFFLPFLYLIYLVLHHHAYLWLCSINHGRELNRVLGATARNIFIYGIITFVTVAAGGLPACGG